jgi:hypothetical protein
MSLWITSICAGLVLGMLIAIGLIYAQMVRLSRPPECEICGGRIVVSRGQAQCEFCGQEWQEPYED